MEEKDALLLEQQAHLSQVEGGRQLYRHDCQRQGRSTAAGSPAAPVYSSQLQGYRNALQF